MTTCTHCHRNLTREPLLHDGLPYGPKCYATLFGGKPVKPAKHIEDERQGELFPSLWTRIVRLATAWWNDVTDPGVHV